MTQRHRRIGGSELAALIGLSNFGTQPIDVFNRIIHGVSSFTGNPYSDRGTKYEPIVRAEYRRRYPDHVPQEFATPVLWGEEFAASMDDVYQCGRGKPYPCDYKTASINSMRKWAPSGQPLARAQSQYQTQLDLYMAVIDAEFSRLFVAFGEDVKDASGRLTGEFRIVEYRDYIIPRNPERESVALEAGRKFWREHIVPRIPPCSDRAELVDSISNPGANMTAEELAFFGLAPAVVAAPAVSASLPQRSPTATSPGPDTSFAPTLATERKAAGMPPIIQETPEEKAAAEAAYAAKRAETLAAAAETIASRFEPDETEDGDPATLEARLDAALGDKPKRIRRTKAQMEAARAAETAGVVRVTGTVISKTEYASHEAAVAAVKAGAATRAQAVANTAEAAGHSSFCEATVGAPCDSKPLCDPEYIPAIDSRKPEFILYVDCLPGSGARCPIESLEPYVMGAVAALASVCGAADIRASEAKPLGFGKWKGALAEWFRNNPPPNGVYFLMTRGSEFAQIAAETLPHAARGV